MSARRLPSLTALRAFEAAGRHRSLTAAAAELHVSTSAISHQVRLLEQDLGEPLFVRGASGLALTSAGADLLGGLSDGFMRITQAVAAFHRRRPARVLTVSTLSTFAMRWLIPRLGGFNDRHPEIDVRIATSVLPVDLERADLDCAIRFGGGGWPGLSAERLFAERLTPVCSPRLPTAERPLSAPAHLARHRLLHARLRPDDWRLWLHAAGVADCDPRAGPVFETRNFVIQAALQGLGVAVLDPALVADELAAGRLVQPFQPVLPYEGAYWFVCRPDRAGEPAIAAFRAWLLAESTDRL